MLTVNLHAGETTTVRAAHGRGDAWWVDISPDGDSDHVSVLGSRAEVRRVLQAALDEFDNHVRQTTIDAVEALDALPEASTGVDDDELVTVTL